MSKLAKFGGWVALALMWAAAPAYAAEQVLLRNGFAITFESLEVSGTNTRLYLTAEKNSYVDVATADIVSFGPAPPSASPVAAQKPLPAPDVNQIVAAAAAQHELDPELINSVIRAESSFNSRAVSRKGARGLMQLMPGTAEQLGVVDSFDAASNVNGGTKYLRTLLVANNYDLAKALAAYNSGQHRVTQYRGVPPYHETRAYVAKIIRDFNRKKVAQQAPEKTAKALRPSATAHSAMR